MYIEVLALNNQQWFICHKTQPKQVIYIWYICVLFGPVKPELGGIPSGQENHSGAGPSPSVSNLFY